MSFFILTQLSPSLDMSNIDRLEKSKGEGFLSPFIVDCIQMVKNENPRNGKGTIYYKGVYSGYRLEAEWEEGLLQGNATLFTKEDVKHAELTFQDDELEGPCCIYGGYKVVFRGSFSKGLKQGCGREYDDKGNCTFIGIYDQGVKIASLKEVENMSGFWEERSLKTKLLISVSQYSPDFLYKEGLCFEYKNGYIASLNEYVKGESYLLMREFDGPMMTVFDENGMKQYEGTYEDNLIKHYPRCGQGKEFSSNGRTLIYDGEFKDDKRCGHGISFDKNCPQYEGEWMNNYPNGQGVRMMEDGSILYHGEWHFGYYMKEKDIWIDYDTLKLYYGTVDMLPEWSLRNIREDSSLGCTLETLSVAISVQCPHDSFFVRSQSDFENIPKDVKNIAVLNEVCNDPKVSSFVFKGYPNLCGIYIGDCCFKFVSRFELNDLVSLERVVIGARSFTLVKEIPKLETDREVAEFIIKSENIHRSFQITKCPNLIDVSLGSLSFFDYHTCEITEVNSLRLLKFGEIGRESFNFNFCPVLCLSGLRNLEELEFGASAFCYVQNVILSNLLSLREIRLHTFALYGDQRDGRKKKRSEWVIYKNSIVMRSKDGQSVIR